MKLDEIKKGLKQRFTVFSTRSQVESWLRLNNIQSITMLNKIDVEQKVRQYSSDCIKTELNKLSDELKIATRESSSIDVGYRMTDGEEYSKKGIAWGGAVTAIAAVVEGAVFWPLALVSIGLGLFIGNEKNKENFIFNVLSSSEANADRISKEIINILDDCNAREHLVNGSNKIAAFSVEKTIEKTKEEFLQKAFLEREREKELERRNAQLIKKARQEAIENCFAEKTSRDSSKIVSEPIKERKQFSSSAEEIYEKHCTNKERLPTYDCSKANSQLSAEQLAIKSFLEARGIRYLVHFTDTRNVDSIKSKGILSIKRLGVLGVPFFKNDQQRLDGELDYISLSVTNPNRFVMNSFIKNGSLSNVSIIYIKADILYEDMEHKKIYCDRNAAAGTCQKGSTLKDFENMFRDEILYNTYAGEQRYYSRIFKNNNEPTDEQAEILFEGKIDKKYIYKIDNR